MSDQPPPGQAPRPGDPRSPGPRPEPTLRDLAWVLFAVGLVAITAVQVVGLLVAVTRLETAPSTLGLVLGFLVTVGWFLTVAWFALGAWRRSVWGCPFEHTSATSVERRCRRHRLLPPG